MMACTIPFDDDIFAIGLQLEEIEAQRERQTGKWSQDSPPDFALAYLDFETELKRAVQLVEDLKIAHSFAQAVDVDAAILQQMTTEESQAHEDQIIASKLQDDDAEHPDLAAITRNSGIDNNFAFESWNDLVLTSADGSAPSEDVESTCESITSTFAGPSVSYALRQQQVLQQLQRRELECVACKDQFHLHRTIKLDCIGRHVYCKACLKELFLLSTKDESFFPPKCCGTAVPVSLVEETLTIDEFKAFQNAEVEYSSFNRVYCAHAECGRFIPVKDGIDERAYCEACKNETCVHCKSKAHEGDCPADEVTQNFIEFAAEQLWQRCFGCRRMVDRPEGCNHMTCICGTEFCYRCGVVWKECSCDDWEPELRVIRAEQVVDREAQYDLPPAARRLRVRAMEQRLERNHECTHHGRWQRRDDYRRRGYTCDFCGDQHWKYILACRHCHVIACETCRRHRV